jgi:hypothetical protein
MVERFARIPLRAAGIRDLHGRDLQILVAISAHADLTGRAYPSMSTLAEMTGMGRGDVPRSIRRLEALGLISRESRPGRGCIYVVIFDAPVLPTVSTRADSVEADSIGAVSADTPQLSAPVLPTVSTRAALTYITKKNISSPRERGGMRVPAGGYFDRFWRSYPSRGGQANPKKPAQEKFAAAVKRGVDPELLIRAAMNYADCMQRSGTAGRYIKTAEVWLNKASWEQYGDVADDSEPLRAGMI